MIAELLLSPEMDPNSEPALHCGIAQVVWSSQGKRRSDSLRPWMAPVLITRCQYDPVNGQNIGMQCRKLIELLVQVEHVLTPKP